jgi:uncharacterized protein (DUF433 family)
MRGVAIDWRERLWWRTTVSDTGCWEFAGFICPRTGQPRISIGGGKLFPRRLVYSMVYGEIDPMTRVIPDCGNERCINPSHCSLAPSKKVRGVVKESLLGRIGTSTARRGGRPCIRETGVRVTEILSMLGTGASIGTVIARYPVLERLDVLAAIQYAAAILNRADN